MSYPRYPAYKDSGVEWLGEVPEHWKVTRVKRLFEIKKHIAGVDGYEVLSITQQGIKVKDIESGDGQLSMDYSKYQFVEVGDFAMNHMDLLTGYIDISPVLGVTSPDYRVFSVRDPGRCFDRYYLYLFQSGYKNKIFYAFGQGSSQLGRWRFPTDQFNDFEFPSPPLPEQRAIAAFLDGETARVDALVAKQEALIALLQEKRKAVISHAVTKGLNPDAPMKDSGVAWLGEVPAHWEVIRLKRIAQIRYGLGQPPREDDQGVPIIRATNIDAGRITNRDLLLVDPSDVPEGKNALLAEGEIIVVRSGAYTGDSAIIPLEYVGSLAGYDMVVTVTQPVQQYVAWTLLSAGVQNQFDLAKLRAAQPHLNAEELGETWVVLPDKAQQIEIVKFIECETARIDALIAKAEQFIERLREHRTALIAAAVTGKIDVRTLTPQPPLPGAGEGE